MYFDDERSFTKLNEIIEDDEKVATMSKDIWHTADEYNYSTIAFPEDAIVVDTGGGKYWAYSSFDDMPHHCDDPDCCFAETSCWKRWAKLDDLLALETELERTRKALDVALCSLQDIAESNGDFITGASTPLDEHEYADMMLKEIKRQMKIKTALEQKDK